MEISLCLYAVQSPRPDPSSDPLSTLDVFGRPPSCSWQLGNLVKACKQSSIAQLRRQRLYPNVDKDEMAQTEDPALS